MKQLQYELDTKLLEVLGNVKKRKSFNRDHIFYDIIELIKNKVSVQQKLKIIYTFSEIEKTLSNLKGGDKNYEFQIRKIDSIYYKLDDELKHYLSLSYYPMKALYHFEKKELDSSIDCLKKFFDNSTSILGTNNSLLNLACGEQYLNLFRIYVASNNEKGVIKCSSNLMLLCHYKILISDSDETIATNKKFVNSFNNFEENEYLFWKVYHTDNIFKRFITKPDDNLLQRIVSEILSNMSEVKNDFFYNSLKSLDSYYKNANTDSINYFLNSLNYFDERSDALFYINIKKIDSMFSNLGIQNERFKNICNDFISNNLIKINNQTKVELLT